MGNGVTVRSITGIISLLAVFALFASVSYASADTLSAQLKKRLCDRQDTLGGRLVRPLIKPAQCVDEPTPVQPVVTLSASPQSINAGESTTLTWSSSNATNCTAFLGWNGNKALSGSESVSPTVTTTYQLDCTGPGGVGSDDAVVTVVVAAPDEPTVEITATPMTIIMGSSSELSWNSENAESCVASNGWSGSKALDGSQNVSPSATTTYTITCTGDGGTASDSVTVAVNAVPASPTLALTVASSSITQGASTTLTWDSDNTSTCTASNGWTGARAVDGFEVVSPATTTTYTLACTGAGGTATSSVTITVTEIPEPTVTLSANPTFVTTGGTTTLSWSSTNATNCTAFLGWSGAKATTGVEVVAPTATTTYQLDCTGPGGTGSDDAVVNFASTSTSTPPTLQFSANPTTVFEGSSSEASSTLTWDSSNTTSCNASIGWTGGKSLDGSEVVTPSATTTYVLDCSGPGGNVQATTTVNFAASTTQVTLDHILISEVYDQPDAVHGADTVNEWIELYNPTAASVDLSLWSIKDATTNFDVIPNGTSIPAGGFLILTNASTTPSFWSIPGGVQVIAFESALGSGLNNSNETLFLRNAATTTIDSLSWGDNTDGFVSGAGAVDVLPGHSLYRPSLTIDSHTNADWADHASSTPGLPN